ncbi:MAG TPA: Ig-like domain-containing protein, partial [Ohtaekwangia sp.]|nr:Ig-like domain-containing protein [Ohtaekwangia sp.]
DTDVDGTIDASTVDLDPNAAGIQNTFSTTEGDWSVDADGDVTYTPALNFNGSASISYTVEDNSGATSSEGTITVTVSAVNDAPVAVLDEPTTNEDTPLVVNVTSNDTDVDGTVDGSTVDLDQGTAGIQQTLTTTAGTWAVDGSGDLTFSPSADFNGTADISYTIQDDDGTVSNVATITVTVTPVNDPAVAVMDEPTTNEDTPLTFNVTSNDTDVDGTVDPATVDLDTSTPGTQNSFTGLNGTWSVDALGSITFTPNLNFNGVESISYTVNDNDGATSDPGTISITVVDVNDPPVAIADNFSLNEDTPLTFDPLTNDSDVDGTLDASSLDLDPATTTVEHSKTTMEGTWSVDASGEITFVPVLNFNGNATITYVVRDDDGGVSEVMSIELTVDPVNDAPVLQDNTVTTTQGLQASGNIINAGDFDPDGTPLVVSTIPVTAPAHGTIVIHADGSYQYTSDPGFTGTDVIVMQVCDGGLPLPASCVTTTLIVKVVTNQPPVVSVKNPMGTEDIRFDGNVIGGGDHDPEGLGLVVSTSPVQEPVHGVVNIDTDGTYSYTPDEHYYGTDVFKIEVCDTNPAPACSVVEITIQVAAVNDAPVITDDVVQGLINGTATGNILVNDTDPDNASLVVNMIPVSGPSHGSIVMDASGIYTYTPDHNFTGTDEVAFEICDDETPALCGTNTITITVTDPHAGEVFIPEGFSPNGDGVNDHFVIGYTGDKKIHLEIYNRWGNLVYKNENYQNDWNGDSMYGLVVGSDVPDGTYFYKVQVGKIQKVKSFTIQR